MVFFHVYRSLTILFNDKMLYAACHYKISRLQSNLTVNSSKRQDTAGETPDLPTADKALPTQPSTRVEPTTNTLHTGTPSYLCPTNLTSSNPRTPVPSSPNFSVRSSNLSVGSDPSRLSSRRSLSISDVLILSKVMDGFAHALSPRKNSSSSSSS